MHGVNGWLMGLSFVLGLLLTFAFSIRWVTREVPVSTEAETTVIPVGGAPYGEGSARPGEDGSGPAGWTIKGNEDSMLYHGPESPSYGQTIAEVWFADEQTAEAAGFTRWDAGGTK
ncbi:channel accessory protein ArfC, sunset domain variant [Mycolicibacter kumamotonensis]|jgi:uncharacterized membrane protein ArfC|uniref:Uncharacterized protein n=1 Tax=Mycolicibacter kumamotonensis TaxID=354243 RepID=A0A1B8SLG2_9MYCO|nr:hypothetical protein [Mycolicibacter kumamotonensis]NDJ88225.1 hypothetical protein [Mycolicibacter kumamotonensis]OBY33592.1 hypothetical protein ACT18_01320 [Mycolicibacter kumamotonensis]ORA80797.1 hypothetical protein BST28_08570 [Mycolicibacter kumamotonensis]